jgi:hypothetical protein
MSNQEEINVVRGKIKESQKESQSLYSELVEKLGMEEGEDDDLLFDYIFNCDEDVTYEEYISG